jgi:opacity protein-like surface antigen
MSIYSSRLGLAFTVAALCLGGPAAHAQSAPLSYWIPGWPIGFGGDPAAAQGANAYGNFPSFDGSDGFSSTRYNFSNGWFVGSEAGGMGLSLNGIGQDGAFGNLRHQSMQLGYNFQNKGGLPVTVYAGFDTLKYNTGIGSPFAPFDSVSSTLPVYSAHAGVEFRPTSNVSLSLGLGYTQQTGRLDSDLNSPSLPGASPLAVMGPR